ncbi:MAG TPA: hypothetical protein VEB60_01405 [Candidatus Paceibacterota bacterium]|nr:hypothetical protein [Candidatus Paceibacterota bacterium]
MRKTAAIYPPVSDPAEAIEFFSKSLKPLRAHVSALNSMGANGPVLFELERSVKRYDMARKKCRTLRSAWAAACDPYNQAEVDKLNRKLVDILEPFPVRFQCF